MAVLKYVVFIVGAVVACCESAAVDRFTKKCSINDSDCLKDVIQDALRNFSKSGAPEFGIGPFDPIELKNINIFILNMINITMVDGVAKGVKHCVVDKLTLSIEDGHAYLELTCDITVKGHYQLFSDSPLIKTFLGNGGTIHGDGNGKVKLEKLKISFDYYFNIVKRGDDYFINSKFDKSKYTYDILGKMSFAADNLYVGKEESSAKIIKLMNENWRLIINASGKQFVDKALEYVYAIIQKIFNSIPTKHYITDDLSSYVIS